MARSKSTLWNLLYIVMVLLVTGFVSLNYYFITQDSSASSFQSKNSLMASMVFKESKSLLLKEDNSPLFSGGCSQLYGIQEIELFRHNQIKVCSGLKESSVNCCTNPQYKVPRVLCTINNGRFETILSEKDALISEMRWTVDCDLQVKERLPKSFWQQRSLLTNVSNTSELICGNYVEHPVLFLNRYAARNIFHALEDLVTIFESLLILNLDPINVELIIWDNCAVDSVLLEIWKPMFGKGVRLLNANTNTGATCFRLSILNMGVVDGGSSHLTRANATHEDTPCSHSPILKSLRYFLLQKMLILPKNSGQLNSTRRIGFISRHQYKSTPNIGRVIENEAQLLSHLKKRLPPFWTLKILRPELMTSFKEQVDAFDKLDVLIGVHGAGLANVMFMNSGSYLIEIFLNDRDESNRHYRNMCRWLGINYKSPGYFYKNVVPSKIWKILSAVIKKINSGSLD